MNSYRVIGIDPALTNVGVVLLVSDSPSDFRVIEHETIRTQPREAMLDRLNTIRQGLTEFWYQHVVRDNIILDPIQAVAIEDPTAQIRVRTKRQSPRDIAVMSLAIGVAVGQVQELVEGWENFTGGPSYRAPQPAIAFIDTDEWMPKDRSGRLEHIMARPQMTRLLLSRISCPAKASEHVIMAAGVARYWIEQDRLAQRRAAAGVRVG